MQTFLIPPVLENKIALIKPLEEAHFDRIRAGTVGNESA